MTDIQTALITATNQLTTSSESAALDAEVLLCHAIKKTRSHLRAWPEKHLSEYENTQFQHFVSKRLSGVPVAYITGEKEFWSRNFKINTDVLIPRPDTELLIELSLSFVTNKPNAHLIDLGTGSGVIAITLAAERPDLNIIASDMSSKALLIAKNNAINHQTNQINFIQSNWFNGITPTLFDLVISNPPYINQNDPHLSQGDVRFEPNNALIADNKGLADIQTISDHARHYLKPGATLLIEHGYDQQSAVQSIFNSFHYHNIKTHADLSGNPRVTTGEWHPS